MEYWQCLRKHCGKDTLILSGAACCIERAGRILLVRNRDFDLWQMPGGFQEKGESLPQTAEREVREELGLSLRAGALISVYSHPDWEVTYPSGDRVQQLCHFFRMTGDFDETDIRLQVSEVSGILWVDPAHPPREMIASSREMLRDVLIYHGAALLH